MPSQTAEDYLERIYELIETKGYARVADIAHTLSIAQPTVTRMVQKLAEEKYLDYERYRGLNLTARGREVAENIRRRHHTLAAFFELLGLEKSVALQQVDGIEHHLSDLTVERLNLLVAYMKKTPSLLKHLRMAAR